MTQTKPTLAGQLRLRATALNAAEVATLLQISREAVYRYAQQQVLPSLRFGDFVRFDPTQLADWLDAGQLAAAALLNASIDGTGSPQMDNRPLTVVATKTPHSFGDIGEATEVASPAGHTDALYKAAKQHVEPID